MGDRLLRDRRAPSPTSRPRLSAPASRSRSPPPTRSCARSASRPNRHPASAACNPSAPDFVSLSDGMGSAVDRREVATSRVAHWLAADRHHAGARRRPHRHRGPGQRTGLIAQACHLRRSRLAAELVGCPYHADSEPTRLAAASRRYGKSPLGSREARSRFKSPAPGIVAEHALVVPRMHLSLVVSPLR